MAARWPAISGIQYDTLTILPEDRSVFETDAGPPTTAPDSLSATTRATFDVVLDGADLSTFSSWFEGDLELGEQPFDGLEGLVGDNPSRYKFVSTPEFRMIKSGSENRRLWRATFDLVRERSAAFVVHANQFVVSGGAFVTDD